MSSGAPQAVSIELLVYQNAQLTRLVRNLRTGPNPLTNARNVAVSPDVGAQLDQLILRNRQLETRILKSSLLGERNPSLSDGRIDGQTPSVPLDSGITDASSVECTNCKFVKDCYVRVSMALAILQSRFKEVDNATTSPLSNSGLQHVSIELDSALSKLYAADKSLSELQKETEVRASDLILSFGNRCELLDAQTSHFISEIMEYPELQHMPRFTPENPAVPCGLDQGGSTDEILQSSVYAHRTEIAETLNKLRDQLRLKEEQLSRTLMQHINQQVQIGETERENLFLRQQIVAQGVTKADLDAVREAHSRLISVNGNRMDALVNEVIERQNLLNLCLAQINQCSCMASNADGYRGNFEGVLRSLQAELKKSAEDLAEAKRIRFSAGLGQGSSTLLNIELDDLKKRVKCTLCGTREKSVALATCMHCFCRECVNQQMLAARNRKCPLCNQRFADADVRDVHFLQC